MNFLKRKMSDHPAVKLLDDQSWHKVGLGLFDGVAPIT